MSVTITGQTFITAGAVVTAIALLISYFAKLVHFFDEQKKQSDKIENLELEIKALRDTRDQTVNSIKEYHNTDMNAVREEQQLLIYCSLACLKGLQQLGANGEVSQTIEKIEKHLNTTAHGTR